MKKLSTHQIVTAGLLLTLIIVSQFFKNLSVFITGPIVNTILIIATLSCGPAVGIILSIISPITSFFITQSPIISAIPLIIPAIIAGNIILCLGAHFGEERIKNFLGLMIGLVTGSLLKALFMGAVISNFLLVVFNTSLPPKAIAVAKNTFSVTQLLTSMIGSAFAFAIWKSIKAFVKNPQAE